MNMLPPLLNKLCKLIDHTLLDKEEKIIAKTSDAKKDITTAILDDSECEPQQLYMICLNNSNKVNYFLILGTKDEVLNVHERLVRKLIK